MEARDKYLVARLLPVLHTSSFDAWKALPIQDIEHRDRDQLVADGKLLEAQRLEQRTNFDLEMLEATGVCNGIENYSRHLTGRKPGDPPPTLLDYFPDDFLLFMDESHIGVPQLRGMYRGDRSRKKTLVEYGFRLPSALDNRPLRFEEWEAKTGQTILNVTDAKVITDRDTGRSRGFGFVELAADARSNDAISDLDGTSIDGRAIKVNQAKPRS